MTFDRPSTASSTGGSTGGLYRLRPPFDRMTSRTPLYPLAVVAALKGGNGRQKFRPRIRHYRLKSDSVSETSFY